jgi:hypothetical protein
MTLPFLKEKAHYAFFADAIRVYRNNNDDHKPLAIVVHPFVMAEFKKELFEMRLVIAGDAIIQWCGVVIREDEDAVYPMIVDHLGAFDYL